MTYSRNGTKMMSHDLDCNEDTGNPLQEIEPAFVALQGRVNNWHTLSSHYEGMLLCNENCNDSREFTSYDNSVFHTYKGLLLKVRIRSLMERILAFKRVSSFWKGTQLVKLTARVSKLPLLCGVSSAFWLRSEWRFNMITEEAGGKAASFCDFVLFAYVHIDYSTCS